MLTSTSPLLLLRPMVIRLCLTMYSNSRPSSRAMGAPFDSGFHCIFVGLVGADLRARSAQASLSCVLEYVDMVSIFFPPIYISKRFYENIERQKDGRQ